MVFCVFCLLEQAPAHGTGSCRCCVSSVPCSNPGFFLSIYVVRVAFKLLPRVPYVQPYIYVIEPVDLVKFFLVKVLEGLGYCVIAIVYGPVEFIFFIYSYFATCRFSVLVSLMDGIKGACGILGS